IGEALQRETNLEASRIRAATGQIQRLSVVAYQPIAQERTLQLGETDFVFMSYTKPLNRFGITPVDWRDGSRPLPPLCTTLAPQFTSANSFGSDCSGPASV